MNKLLLAVIAALVLCAGVFITLRVRPLDLSPSDSTATSTSADAASSSVAAKTITADTPAAAGMKRFYDQPHHFTLEYPDNLQISEFPGAGSSLMVAFKDPSTGGGFQVFAVPYNEPKITQQRFEMDEPSGVMQDAQNITVDGAPATAFDSHDQAMGDTAEIWFLNGGILYEVTTFRSLDPQLLQILGTWQFVQ